MQEVKNEIVDTGVDNNNDGHCDKCGWYVDKNGKHKIRLLNKYILYNDLIKEEKINYNDNEIDYLLKNYYNKTPYSSYDNQLVSYYNIIKKYTENDPNDPIGCKAINSFLRFDKKPTQDYLINMIENIFSMNYIISQFVVKKPFTVYRGMKFENVNNELINCIDKVYKTKIITEYVDPGFVSTSRDAKYAVFNALEEKQSVVASVFLEIDLLEGAKAMPLSKLYRTTSKDYEKEVLLESGQKFIITYVNKTTKDKTTLYYVKAFIKGDK